MHHFHVARWEFDDKGNKVRPRTLQSRCKACTRMDTRERKGFKPRQPSKTGYLRRTDAEIRAARKYCKDRYASLTEEQRRARREYQRFWAEKRRREQGIEPREFKRNVGEYRTAMQATAAGEELLDPVPIMDYLNEREIVSVPGVHDNTILVIRKGKKRSVSLDLVDRILTSQEDQILLDDMYPADY